MPKIAFTLSLIGTVFLAVSGLAFISSISYLWFYSYETSTLILGCVIILFLLIGAGLMYSNNKNRVIAGSIIVLICLGLSAPLGFSAISYGQIYYNINYANFYFIQGTFYMGLFLLLIGCISGLVWKPSPPSPPLYPDAGTVVADSSPYLPSPPFELKTAIYQKPFSNTEISEIEEKIKKVKEFLTKLEEED
ncbi:MAG: hypothetical protein QW385_00715 [Thermoproteota archaeon]